MNFKKALVIVPPLCFQTTAVFAQGVRDRCALGECGSGDAGFFGWFLLGAWIVVMIWRWRETLAATAAAVVFGFLISPVLGAAVWFIVWIWVSHKLEVNEERDIARRFNNDER